MLFVVVLCGLISCDNSTTQNAADSDAAIVDTDAASEDADSMLSGDDPGESDQLLSEGDALLNEGDDLLSEGGELPDAEGFGSDESWTVRWGSDSYDVGNALALKGAEDIYVAGATWSTLDGNTRVGLSDAVIAHWRSDGTPVWARQFGSQNDDNAAAVAVGGNGTIYVAGWAAGPLDGSEPPLHTCGYGRHLYPCPDIFVGAWAADGSSLWMRSWGVETAEDYGRSIAIDGAGALYVTGDTHGSLDGNTLQRDDLCDSGYGAPPCSDIFLTKWDAAGTKLWTRQWGTGAADSGSAVTVDDAGSVYVAGNIDLHMPLNTGDLIYDAFVTKLSSDGIEQWTTRITPDGGAMTTAAVVARNGYVYVAGTSGSLDRSSSQGGSDLFLSKIDPTDGSEIWMVQWGSALNEQAFGMTIDDAGTIFVTGHTYGVWDALVNAGGADIFLSAWSAEGVELWSKLYGDAGSETAGAVIAGPAGELYLTGQSSPQADKALYYDESADILLMKRVAE